MTHHLEVDRSQADVPFVDGHGVRGEVPDALLKGLLVTVMVGFATIHSMWVHHTDRGSSSPSNFRSNTLHTLFDEFHDIFCEFTYFV